MNSADSKIFGSLLVDFVNADGTENALHSFLYNLQYRFSFSGDFYERVKRLFPSINVFAASLNKDEHRLLELILIKNRIVERLNKQFKLINYGIENYDPFARTISLISLEWNRDNVTGGQRGSSGVAGLNDAGFLQTLNLLGLSIVDGPVSIKLDVIKGEIENLLGPLAAGEITNLIEAGHSIEEIVAGLRDGKYEALQTLAEEHRELIEFHKKVGDLQSDCASALTMLMDGRPYAEIPALVALLDIYNTAEYQRLIIAGTNRLLAVFPIDERKYFAIRQIEGWLEAVQKVIAFCLIEFLKPGKNLKYLKKCRTCGRVFIARQPNIQKFCRKECRTKRRKPALSSPHAGANVPAGFQPS